jgi:hypothetical protein
MQEQPGAAVCNGEDPMDPHPNMEEELCSDPQAAPTADPTATEKASSQPDKAGRQADTVAQLVTRLRKLT